MQTLTVRPGDTVTPGQQIGEADNVSGPTGYHLNYEVHLRGGFYGKDDVDPRMGSQPTLLQGTRSA